MEGRKMNTTERLQQIRARCVVLAEQYPACESVAGWRATIAAIDCLLDEESLTLNQMSQLNELLAVWEGIL